MKKLWAALALLALWNVEAKGQNLPNLPIECDPCRCSSPCPDGTITYTNVVVWPDPNICGLGCWVAAWPEEDWSCPNVVTHYWWENATTNCPDVYVTNSYPYSCPEVLTNWYIVNGPGSYFETGPGNFVWFQPTNCGSGSVTFYCQYGNRKPCEGNCYSPTNYCNVQTTSKSQTFTVKCGLQQIVGQGSEPVTVSPTWPVFSTSLLLVTNAFMTNYCPFTVSYAGSSISASMTWIEELFCCTNQCGSGIVRFETTPVNVSNPDLSLDGVNFSVLSFFPDWLQDCIDALSPLDTNNWVGTIQSWAGLMLNFSVSGSANLVFRHNSDGCLSCDTGTLMDGTASVHVAGSDDLDFEPLNIHVHLGGWVNGEWKGWIVSIGDHTSANYKTQSHYTWFLYASYIIGQFDQDSISTQGGKYDPDPESSTQICWSPNF